MKLHHLSKHCGCEYSRLSKITRQSGEKRERLFDNRGLQGKGRLLFYRRVQAAACQVRRSGNRIFIAYV